ncbi:MAG: YdcF family protein [Clostridiales bacterium]|jgi:uncharacterized SAM-binding protein YcdF (DUF218 family)|nr:YdcF family protein [Clostridiales bacterium]
MNMAFFCSLLSLSAFIICFKKDKSSIYPGLFLDIFAAFAALSYFLISRAYSEWIFFRISRAVISAVLILVSLFGLYILAAFFLWSSGIVLRRRKRTASNNLSLAFGIAIIAFIIASAFVKSIDAPDWLKALWTGLKAFMLVYFAHLCAFLTSLLLCNISKLDENQDFIIVLGCGLKNGEASPLLASRVTRAIEYAARQKAKSGTCPFLVMSGGQGQDEIRPEAEAMKIFAVRQGYDPRHILLESKSRNTSENMAYSKKVIEALNTSNRKCIFATSSFHLLRSGVCARRAGMKIDGIGAKTPLYYLPGAILREYIAYIVMRKEASIAVAGLSFALGSAAWTLRLFDMPICSQIHLFFSLAIH